MMRPAFALVLLALVPGCWRIGEPTFSDAVVAWAAFPDTVVAGEVFPFELAGPITPNTCGRLDTAIVVVTDSSIQLSARRATYDASCSNTPVGFYEVRALELEAGSYEIRTASGRLGRIVALDSGSFSPMRAAGQGTVVRRGGCTLFGPGRLGNQRPFALRGAPPALEGALGTDRLVWVRGTMAGAALCGDFGTRPVIRVSEARVLDRTAGDYYDE